MTKTTARGQKSAPRGRHVELDPSFVPVLEAFAGDEQVTFGGQGFGSRALKTDRKIFAMLSSRGQFVASCHGTV